MSEPLKASLLEGFELSPQQRHLWARLARGGAFRARATVVLAGELDAGLLARALADVVRRHEVLRTRLEVLPGMGLPLQVVGEPWAPALRRADWRELSERARAAETGAYFAAEAACADPAQGPAFSALLAELGPALHLLLLSAPSLYADAAGIESLAREIARSYAAGAAGEALPAAEFQYADLAAWQNELLEAPETSAGRELWARQLLAADLGAALPWADGAAPPAQGPFAPRAVPVPLPGALADALAAEAVAGLPSPLLALAAWQVLLGRATGRSEPVVGVGFDGRRFAEMQGTPGLFARYLPVRARLDRGLPLPRLVARLGAELADAAQFQESFSWRPLAPADEPPSFPFCFELDEERGPWRAGSLTVTVREAAAIFDRFQLRLACRRSERGFAAELGFDPERVSEAEARRLAGWLGGLLAGFLAHPEAAVDGASPLGPAERQQLLVEHQDARCGPAGELFPARFAAAAAERPEAPALAEDGRHLTYGEVARAAAALARRLAALGVGPEERVALLAERSVGAVVGLLGIFEAGGAYVPLDSTLPPSRLVLMARDAGAVAVVASSAAVPLVEALGLPALAAEGGDGEAEGGARRPAPWPESLAYVLYTSGSTGRPKGVAVEHRQLAAYTAGVTRRLGLPPGASCATGASLAADLGHTAIFPCLAGGGCLHLLGQDLASDAAALAAYFRRHAVDLLKIVPSHLAALLAAEPGRDLLPRRWLVLGGEASRPEWAAWLQELAPEVEVCNHYGPTETTVGVLAGAWKPARKSGEAGPGRAARTLPLGRPLPGARACAVDRGLLPVPAEWPGELVVGGGTVSRGYLGAPARTAERFVPDGQGGAAGGRLYRTGDLVRCRLDGRFEFLGRIDQQVKVRGFRVELGEIEAALAACPGVVEAAVAARPEGRDGRRLVAYVVAERGAPPAPQALRRRLAESLPDYMLPAAFAFLPALPRLPSGKVDRQGLPEPQAEAEAGAAGEPRTLTEELLAGLWAQVLGRARVGVFDHFFQTGGNSLQATQVVSRVRRTFGVELSIRSLFEAPVLADQARRIDGARGAGRAAELPAIEPLPRDPEALAAGFPLSFAQQRLWFLDRLEPASPAYHIAGGVRLAGDLDAAALAASLGEVARRHEALRTRFVERGDGAAQVVDPPRPWVPTWLDLGGLPGEAQGAALERLAAREARRPFDLARGPLARAVAVRLGRERHALLLTLHHVIADGWSIGVLVREVAAVYAAARERRPSPLPPLPVQYADYAAWQRRALTEEALAPEIAYWRARLAGLPPLLELPADRPRPTAQSFAGARLPVAVPAPLAERLRAACRGEGVTLFMALLAAFQVLLARASGQTDAPVGVPVAHRTLRETEELIGFFANTLVLRTGLGGAPSFRELLARVRETTLGAYAHQHLPFERLVEELAPERDLARSPLFQVVFALRNLPVEPLGLPGLALSPLELDTGTAKFDLVLMLSDEGSALGGTLEYATDLFDRTTAARLAAQLGCLLAAAVEGLETSILALPLLSPAARHQLVDEWNDSRRSLPAGLAHELAAAQATAGPEAVAVVAGEERLSRGELERRAERWAWALAARGVGPEVVVGLVAERGLPYWVAALAALKAGGAFLPVDPHHPAERQARVLSQSRAALVVVGGAPGPEGEERVLAPLAATGRRLLRWEELLAAPAAPAPLGRRAEPDQLANVFYTSGSTGQPKGAMVSHRGMANHLWLKIGDLGLGAADRVAQTASHCFDISVWQFLAPLLVGGSVELVSDEVAQDPRRLAERVAGSRVSVLQTVPSLLRLLVEDGAPPARRELAALDCLVSTGEALAPELARAWFERFPAVPVVNAWGATECSDDVTHVTLREAPAAGAVHLSLGRSLDNCQVYALDRRFRPVPPGVASELYIAGTMVGRGYLHDPRRTAVAFLPDPVSGRPGSRIYRTGDLGCVRPGGDLRFLGRVDAQVKVHGHRIELGEVESALRQHPGVRDGVVLARPDARGDRRLVAYVVAGGEGLGAAELKGHLGGRLPAYMVPAAFVFLDAFPLTSTGKVDRRALPEPEAPDAGEERYEAPRTQTEEVVAAVWCELLGRERVGAGDDFFELGGHSLLATRVVTRLRDAFGVELPLRAVFEEPTLAGLAAAIEAAAAGGDAPSVSPIRPVPREGRLPLSFAQQRLWFVDQLEPGSSAYNMRGAYRLEGPFEVAAARAALAAVVARHEVLRTTFQEVGGEPSQVIGAAQVPPLPLVDLGGLPAERREAEACRLAVAEGERPFDLARGPLLRTRLVRLGAADHAALFTLHHIAADGWSMGVLLGEFNALYGEAAGGPAAALPELPVQYADFAVWQREIERQGLLEAGLEHWRRRLGRPLPALRLPVDRPRGAGSGYAGGRLPIAIPAPLAGDLARLARREGATLFMLMASAFATLLHTASGQEDLLLGAEIANRNRREVEGLIGFFVNLLPLRLDLSGDPSFRALLARVRETALAAFRHQDVPFDRVVEAVEPERGTTRVPLIQAMLVVQNAPRTPPPAGLAVSELPVANETAKFDLLLAVEERDGEIAGRWHYAADLFDAATIGRLSSHLLALLGRIAARPDERLSELPRFPAGERSVTPMSKSATPDSRFKSLLEVKPRAVAIAQESLVRSRELSPGRRLPLLVEPAVPAFDLAGWARSERPWIEDRLGEHGAILFRGAGVEAVADFERFASALCPELFGEYGDLPREDLGDRVYSSTPYPADQPILFHNESSQLHLWPRKQWFYCAQPAAAGGETPIADCREVYRRLDPALCRRFEEKGLRYVRNFIPDLDVPWREFFHTGERAEVEDLCQRAGMSCEWYGDDRLRTAIQCRAVASHPRTKEKVFFNQIMAHHVSCLPPGVRESLLALCGQEELPRNVYFGDGSPIEDEVVAELRALYDEVAVAFPWQRGDVLMVDNMLTAHSRNPFSGARKILVAMGDMVTEGEMRGAEAAAAEAAGKGARDGAFATA